MNSEKSQPTKYASYKLSKRCYCQMLQLFYSKKIFSATYGTEIDHFNAFWPLSAVQVATPPSECTTLSCRAVFFQAK
jgi:hypothetical protein